MRVDFSYDATRMQRHGGVSRYVTELHLGLLRAGVDSRLDAWLHVNEHARRQRGVRGLDVSWVRPAVAAKALTKVVDRAIDAVHVRRLPPSAIYHKTYFGPRVPAHHPFAVTVYDMIHERFPEAFAPDDPTPGWKRRLCERADVVLALSDATRDDLLERIAIGPDRVVVAHLGVRVPDAAPPLGAPPAGGPLLYVGERARAYKNVAAVLTALTRLDRGVRLVCFGGGPFTDDERSRFHELGLTDRVSWRAGRDDELARAYREARAFVYPSRWEGFGLPALEAMAHGCPVVCTNAGSLPEVVGDAALTVDPLDTDMLADALARVIGDDACAAALSKAGRERAKAFTWDATAARTIEAYELASS